MPPSFCLIVCEQLVQETQAAARRIMLADVEIKTFPGRCDLPPLRLEKFDQSSRELDDVELEIFGSCCLGQNPEAFRCRIRQMEQCLHLLCGSTLVSALQKAGARLLTPGWLAGWQDHFEVWGLDRPSAIEFFGRSMRRLLLLDTGTDPESGRHLSELSDYVGLPAEVLPTGLEHYVLLLEKFVAEHRQQELLRQQEQARLRAAEAAMTLDMLGMVVKASSESEALDGIAELFAMLFAPRRICCIPTTKKGLSAEHAAALSAEERKSAEEFWADSDRQYLLSESGDGFFLRIGRGDATDAVAMVLQVEFPQYIQSYLNTALSVSGVCALAVEHVRTHKKLLNASRLAGKAEVATEILHNVGNALNSISVSSERLLEMVQQSGCTTLPAIVQLIGQHRENLGVFFDSDPRGRKLPLYFSSLSAQLSKEQVQLLEEIGHQLKQIRRVADIIRSQQDAAKGKGIVERFELAAAIEESLEIFEQKIAERHIVVERSYARLPPMQGERHKILQIAGNLISNAADSFDGSPEEGRKISLRLRLTEGVADQAEGTVVFEVADNGKGIGSTILGDIFRFGFTAKEGGHGFGLHNAANLTAELGGTLTAESAGEGYGAVFKLELPTAARRGG